MASGVFSLDLSDHCPIFCIIDTRQKEAPPHIIEQAFLRDLFLSDITILCAVPYPELALGYFIDAFNSLANKHAPFKKYRVKLTAPWFSPEISEILRSRDVAWAKASSKSATDWLNFIQQRNKCVRKI